MSLSHHSDYCAHCSLHVDACECDYCDDCIERLASIWSNDGGYCVRCRSACEGCDEPVLHGEKRCAVCWDDLQRSLVLVPGAVGLPGRGVA